MSAKDPRNRQEYQRGYQAAHAEHLAQYQKDYKSANAGRLAQLSKEYREENRERLAARRREYRKNNREAICARKKLYREANAEKVAAGKKRWELENAAKKKATYLAYYEANKPEYKKKAKLYYQKNKRIILEKRGEYQKRRYLKNRERLLAQGKIWAANNRETVRAAEHRRRALELGAEGSHTGADIKRLWDKQKHKCAVKNCPHPIAGSGREKYHVDHIRALSRGGTDYIDNLQILCALHNRQKAAKDEYRWAQEQGRLFI